MIVQRSRRALLTAALASSALIACGGGKIESSFVPTRGVLLDGPASTWAQVTLAAYGGIPSTAPTGGVSSSLGSTPILDLTIGTPTLSARIDTLLASGSVSASDLVLLSGGVPDIVAAASAGSPTAAAQAAGQAMADQIRRLVGAGATHVLIVNAYNVGLAPGAASLPGGAAELTRLTRVFNDQVKISIVDLGGSVLLVDAELYFNQARNNPGGFNLTNAVDAACAGSTAGNGTVSASACTSGAFGGNNVNTFLFYDPLFLTPAAQTTFASTAFAAARARW